MRGLFGLFDGEIKFEAAKITLITATTTHIIDFYIYG